MFPEAVVGNTCIDVTKIFLKLFFIQNFREEMDAQRLRDQEEMRLQMLESKKRKFEREEEERRNREEEER